VRHRTFLCLICFLGRGDLVTRGFGTERESRPLGLSGAAALTYARFLWHLGGNMKSLFSIALLIVTLFGNADAFAAMKGTMSGKDATHGSGGGGSCSAAISRCTSITALRNAQALGRRVCGRWFSPAPRAKAIRASRKIRLV
jgi:hypothetical protein